MAYIKYKDGSIEKIDETKELLPNMELAREREVVYMRKGKEIVASSLTLKGITEGE